jgi:hypothetical protein
MMDLDGVSSLEKNGELNIDSFVSNFCFDDCWDGVFPINDGIYYDIWALKHRFLCPNDFMLDLNRYDHALGRMNSLWYTMYARQKLRMDQLQGWLEVDSAFGGMGIYKTSSLEYANYFGMDSLREVVDHASLHANMKQQDMKLYINPKFVVKGVGYTEEVRKLNDIF